MLKKMQEKNHGTKNHGTIHDEFQETIQETFHDTIHGTIRHAPHNILQETFQDSRFPTNCTKRLRTHHITLHLFL
jgi:hypothetical protein